MTGKSSIFHSSLFFLYSKLAEFAVRFINLISPKQCTICGCRLAIGEEVICSTCNIHLPRTHFSDKPCDNIMARMFWGQIPIRRAMALFYYEPHSEVSRIVYSMKYHNHPETGEFMGRMLAEEIREQGFFNDIDLIIPIPLTKKRQRIRGYNQSREIARGVSDIMKIPVVTNAVVRKSFKSSQTQMDRWQRLENVKDVFRLKNGSALKGKHILIIDDVVTTGATIISCSREIMKCGDVKFSVLSLGFTKS